MAGDSNPDERLLTAAKLREQVRGTLDGADELHPHAGIVADPDVRQSLTFVEGLFGDDLDRDVPPSFAETDLGRLCFESFATDEMTEAVHRGDGTVMSHFRGITEQELDASTVTVTARLLDRLDRDGALTTVLAAGAPNTGKTNTMFLLVDLADVLYDDLLVISNVRTWDRTDVVATSCHELAVALLEHRERPKAVVVDEGSTHFDARTNSYEVAQQWSPLHKRMSKLQTEVVGIVGHTGKDVDPEAKRLCNLAFYKEEPESAEFFANWPAESDSPGAELFTGTLDAIEPTLTNYDPDDAAPWSWNLRADLFALGLEWSELLARLQDLGPAAD